MEAIDFMRINMVMVDKIIKSYFDYLKTNNIELTYSELTDLLRHSVCIALGLKSKALTDRLDVLAEDIAKVITVHIPHSLVPSFTHNHKVKILEACVHCIELSRKAVQ